MIPKISFQLLGLLKNKYNLFAINIPIKKKLDKKSEIKSNSTIIESLPSVIVREQGNIKMFYIKPIPNNHGCNKQYSCIRTKSAYSQ